MKVKVADKYLPTRTEVYNIWVEKNFYLLSDSYAYYEIFKIFKKYVKFFRLKGRVLICDVVKPDSKVSHPYTIKENVMIDIIWIKDYSYQFSFNFKLKDYNFSVNELSIINGVEVVEIDINNYLNIKVNISYYVRNKKMKELLRSL